MRKYWLNSLCKMGGALLVALSVIGCTKTDDTTGNNGFIPDGGDYQMYRDSIVSGFKIKTVKMDSISSDNMLSLYLGSQVTPREGQINYSFVTQMTPSSTSMMSDNSAPFGIDPQIDSAFLSLDNWDSGDLGKRYTVYVYELTKSLPHVIDSAYYSNFDYEDYIGSEPIFTIEAKHGSHISTKIPIEYAKKLMSLQGEQYKNYSTFRDKFKGYYIKASSTQSGNIVSQIVPNNSGFEIYYHNKNEKPDTSRMYFDFRKYDVDYYNTKYYINESFNIISRDYSLKDPALGVQYNNDEVAEITYVSGMGGLLTRLEIPQSIIEELKAKVNAKGGNNIMVTNATLTIPNGDNSLYGMDNALYGLGGYLKYQASRNVSISSSEYYSVSSTHYNSLDYMRDGANALSDYYGIYNTISIFGGKLNRATGEYKMVISSTIQGLVNGKHTNNIIEIGPSAEQLVSGLVPDKESPSVSVLENSTKRPIKLMLTYCVVQ